MEPKPQPYRVDDLELEEDYEFQRCSWRLQRWGRFGIYLFLLAGLLGCFGSGWFGTRRVTGAGERVHLEHSRFARYGATYDLKIEADPSLVADGRLHVQLDSSLLDMLQVDDIAPEPEGQDLHGERITYTFRVQASRPVTLVFHLEPVRRGPGSGRVAVGASGDLLIEHFIYP